MAWTMRHVSGNGIRMAVAEEGTGPAVILLHGFPELAYSWRHQLSALAAAGYRAIAPDQRGYGDTECPADVAAYDIHHLTADVVSLLDALSIERAVIAGHDWGGIVGWMMPLLHPDRTMGVIGVNTPYFPRPAEPTVSALRATYGENYYIVHFQQPGVADAALARDVRRVFTHLMRTGVPQHEYRAAVTAATGSGMRNMVELIERGPAPGHALLSEAEIRIYVEAFERTGFTGGLNWYRNLDRNWETTAHLAGARIEIPSLMITAEYDPVLRPELAEPMRKLVPDLELVMISACGHWTQQERPAELNRIMLDWLGRRFPVS